MTLCAQIQSMVSFRGSKVSGSRWLRRTWSSTSVLISPQWLIGNTFIAPDAGCEYTFPLSTAGRSAGTVTFMVDGAVRRIRIESESIDRLLEQFVEYELEPPNVLDQRTHWIAQRAACRDVAPLPELVVAAVENLEFGANVVIPSPQLLAPGAKFCSQIAGEHLRTLLAFAAGVTVNELTVYGEDSPERIFEENGSRFLRLGLCNSYQYLLRVIDGRIEDEVLRNKIGSASIRGTGKNVIELSLDNLR